jgi:rhodanese-related sulfurtransferase
MNPEAFEQKANETDALILDVRHQDEFAQGHIPSSIFIGLDGGFAPWVGALILDIQQPILIVAPKGREEEAVKRLARVGYDNSIGYLEGGFDSWKNAGKDIDTVNSITANDMEEKMKSSVQVFDVRKPGEYESEHIENVPSTPLDFLNNHLNEFPIDEPFMIHCAGGYRSMIAASILKARGFHQVIDVKGGYAAIKNTNIPRTNYVCPSTLK